VNLVEKREAVQRILDDCKADCDERAICEQVLMSTELIETFTSEYDVCQAVNDYLLEEKWGAEEEGRFGT